MLTKRLIAALTIFVSISLYAPVLYAMDKAEAYGGDLLVSVGAALLLALPFDIPLIFGDYSLVIYIIIITVVALVITILLIFRVRKKRVYKSKFSEYDTSASLSNKTEVLTSRNSSRDTKNLCIRLRNTSTADQMWDFALSEGILIGRDTSCQVCLDEASVSRQQCRLFADNTPMIENLSKSNITQLNGKKLKSPAIIKVGDKIKCGRITLVVDSLYESDSQNVGVLNKGTRFINI